MNGTQERKIETIKCPYCKSGKLILKKSNRSTFYGCSNYPYCNYTNNNIHAVEANKRCPVCGDFFVVRNGKYGSFYGCSSYPKCKNTAKL